METLAVSKRVTKSILENLAQGENCVKLEAIFTLTST
jgi:hypothetical protein